MHDAATIERIAERDGVIGLIMAQHQLNDGLRGRRDTTKTLAESMAVIRRHVEAIHDVTGSYRHVAIGSDLDGFIRPTMGGVEDMRGMKGLQEALRAEVGEEPAALICRENALRVLRRGWR
jgi:microsomal dipeptidase-like Zn-dependent dipeptidase